MDDKIETDQITKNILDHEVKFALPIPQITHLWLMVMFGDEACEGEPNHSGSFPLTISKIPQSI